MSSVQRVGVMTAARGDTKPCTVAECEGTMQYGRRRDWEASHSAGPVRDDLASGVQNTRGWVCSVDRDHFRET